MSKIAYSPNEAAEQVCCSSSKITRAISAGELVAHYRDGLTRILHDDLVAWIEQAPTERKSA